MGYCLADLELTGDFATNQWIDSASSLSGISIGVGNYAVIQRFVPRQDSIRGELF